MLDPETPLRLRRLWAAIGHVLIAFVVYASLAPAPIMVPVEHGDKYGHVLAYGTLMLWFGQLHAGFGARVLWACGFATMGVGLEFVQGLTDYRTFEIADMSADTCGVLIGWMIAPPRSPPLFERIESRVFVRR